MRKKVFFGQNDIRFFYYRYKDSNYYSWSLIIAAVAVSAVLTFSVIIPLIRSNLSIRQEVIAIRAKNRVLNENINFMNNLDKSILNSHLQTATQALPPDKDYLSILSALSEAAIISGVTLDDFNFSNSKNSSVESNTSLILIIVINGDIPHVKDFLKEINERLPISEIQFVDNTGESTTVGIEFYYKSFPDISYKEDELLAPLSDSDQELLRKISPWRVGSNFEDFESNTSSPSGAVPIF